MLPPELQPRLFRPHISSTSSSSEQASSSPNYSPHMSPASTRSFIDRRTSGATSRSSNSRFSPSSFAYNGRIALALVPCAAFLLDLGGAPVIATLTVGLLISYIVDSLDVKFGAFLGIWMTLITAQIAFFFSSSSLLSSFNSLPLGLLAAFLCAETTFLIGCWTSLQFKWLQLENPSIVVALERLLFACAPFTASSLFAWATISAVGMSSSSYYFLMFACVFYWLFAIPRVSSFKTKQEAKYHGGEIPEDNYILGPLESSFLSLNLMFMPLLFHVASHYSVMFSSAASVSDLLLLFFVPFLFQLYASTRGGLWWVTKDSHQLQSIRIVNGAIAMVVIVICLEIRVVFRSFGKYIQVPPPLNYLLVTTTMLGGAAGAGASVLGMISSGLSSAFFTALAVIVSSAGAIVVGFPLLFTPLPAVAGLYFARFFTKKSVRSYFAFVALGSLMVIWFVMHNYWDLNIWLAGMFLKSFCKLIVANVIIAMVIPGLVLLPSKFHFLTEAGVVAHALLLCYIEDRFFNYSTIYHYGMEDDVMYPSYMVILTTLIGLAVVRRLFADHRIGSKAVWILTCLYSAKLAMLFLSSKSIVWVAAALLLAVSPPLLLYKEKSKSASKMKPWQGYAHALVVAISVWFCRETIFDAVQWWNGRPPSDGLLLGFCIVLIGLACIPIVALHFSHVLAAKRSLVLVVATGCMFILMQPPMPMTWSYHSEMIKAARQSADDISIYGFMASKPTWPSWLLIVALLLILAAATSLIPIKYVVELRAFYSVAMGLALGVYISAEFFLQAAVLHALIVITMVCASVFVIFTHFPSASSTKLLPWVFALLVALFPVTYLLEGQVRINNDLGDNAAWGWDAREEDKKVTAMLAIEGARTSLLGLYAAIFMLIALLIKFELTSLLREKVSEKSGHSKTQDGARGMFPTRNRLMQQRRATTIQSFAIEKMSEEGAAWMPAVGNVATIVCFAICLILNIHISGGSSQAIFFLAPILLLLNQDSDLLSGFGDKQRYFPVTLAISTYLALSSLYVVWEEVWFGGNAGWGIEIGGREWFFAVKNLALLILTAPGHIIFNRYVWSYSTKNSDPSPMLTLPLSFAAVVITDVFQVRLLGVLGIVYSVAQYVISRQQHIKGLRESETASRIPVRTMITCVLKSVTPANKFIWERIQISPIEIATCPDTIQSMYCQLLCGLIQRGNVSRLGAPFASSFLKVINFLGDHWSELCSNIKTGSVSPWIKDAQCLSGISKFLSAPNPELASIIEKECSKTSWEAIVRRLWPNAKCIEAVVTGSMSQYIPMLEFYGGGLPVISLFYGSSECLFGLNVNPLCKPCDVSYTTVPSMAYFEFLEVKKDQEAGHDPLVNPVVIDLVDVKVGHDYEPVVTTFSGLYRYRLGDVLRVTGFYNNAPQFHFVGRNKVVLSIDMDKTYEEDLLNAVTNAKLLLEPHDFVLIDFTSRVDFSSYPGHYVLYWELGSKVKDKKIEPERKVLEECCFTVEECLDSVYRKGRKNDKNIGPLEIKVVRRGAFDELMSFFVSRGTSVSQYKTPRSVKNEEALKILEATVVSKSFSRKVPSWELHELHSSR